VATLDAITRADVDAAEHAHEYAHGIGIEAYGLSPDIQATFAACGDGYSSGCRHGVIQAYFESRDAVTQSEVEALCQPFKSATASRWVLFQCVHGMGHGLTMYRGHDLRARSATATCSRTGGIASRVTAARSWKRDQCDDAASPRDHAAAHGHHMAMATFKAMDPADPLYPCSIMADRYLHACYQMQTSVMLNLNHGDMADAARSCERAPAQVRPVCFQSLGRDITSYTARDPQKSADMCDKAREPYRPACYFGAAKALVDWTATTESAFTFCRIVAAQPGGPTCYQALGEEIATLLATTPEREEQCLRAQEPQAVDACRRGAGIPPSR